MSVLIRLKPCRLFGKVSVTVGDKLGPYEISARLGAGGMGEVWKARDVRLGRNVAIKTSQQRFSDRFRREAEALSKLNHPHICQIYDVGPDYLVMELIEGSPLRGPLPIRTALDYAEQICSALDAAHCAGIVHRDLKPDNILITRHGVKLLDFGLAKMARAAVSGGDESGLTATMTGATEMVGTLHYMSPEQLQAKPVDSRSDIFSLGTVLHEIITGRRAFAGDSPASVVAAILTGEPRPIAELQPKAPVRLSRVLAVCLAKDPEYRWQSARDLQRELNWLRDAPAAANELPRRSRWKQTVIAAAVLIAIATGAWFLGQSRLADLPAWKVTPLTAYAGNEEMPAISPDGNQVAFVWDGEHQDNLDIYVKQIGDDAPPLRITRDEAVDFAPCWSPDGKRLAFLRRRSPGVDLIVSSSLGGGERILASSSYLPGLVDSTISWSPDGKFIALPDASGIVRVNVNTRQAYPMTPLPPSGNSDMMPAYAPDGAALAFTQGPDLVTREIWIQKLDARGDPSGKPIRAAEDPESYLGLTWMPQRRSILTSKGFPGSFLESLLQPVGGGAARVVPLDSIAVWYPSYNAKRHRLAYQRRWMDLDIIRFSLNQPNAAPTPVISSTHMDYAFDISPDGKRLVFSSTRTGRQGIWRADRDGANQILLAAGERGEVGSPRWSPDGRWIVYDVGLAGATGIHAVSADGGTPRQITKTALKDTQPAVSPDGKWLYFTSKETGRVEIWRQPWTGGTRTQITHGGGGHEMPSPDGKWLYYTRQGSLWRVPPEGGQETKLLDGIPAGYATVAGDSVFYLGREGKRASVFEYHPLTGQSQVVYRSPFPFEPTYPVSAIGVSLATREVFVTHRVRLESDLVLVDNFR